MDKKIKTTIFPYGVHIFREHSRSISEVLSDIKIVKRHGFNMVKIQESWAFNEQIEGKFDFSNIEVIIAEAEKLELFIYFGFTMEQAPFWLWKKYPDCRLVYNTGETHNDPTQYLLPCDGKPGPCWDHPEAREAGKRFISKLVKRLAAYKNILVWNVWQEVGFWSIRKGTLGFCYCHNTLSEFRKWLKEKYGDIKSLNEVWRTGFGEWEDVEPPRLYPAVPSWIDWRYFMNDVYLPNAIRWKVDVVKSNDPFKRPVFCHVDRAMVGSGSQWHYASEVDIFGTSAYPTWRPFDTWDFGKPKAGEPVKKNDSLRAEMWNIALNFDYTRSACLKGQECWAAEFQGGPVVTFLHRGRTPSRSDIRRWVLAALSSGVNGLCFWNQRSEIFWSEAYGFGLLDSNGITTKRFEEAARIGRALNCHADIFRGGTVAEAEVAILINTDLWHFTEATPITGLKSEDQFSDNACRHITHTIRGLYKMLWLSGIWTDFIEAEKLSASTGKKYRVLILPFPIAVSDELMLNLKNYVKNGGTLISEACPGRYSKYGFSRSGRMSGIAEELFGVKHSDLILCAEPGQTHWVPVERSYGEIAPPSRFQGAGIFENHSVLANLYAETYIPARSTPILVYNDKIAGVVNDFGKGRAFLIGTLLGHGGATYEDVPSEKFINKLMSCCDVKPEKCGRLLRRRRILANKEVWFLINPTADVITETISFSGFSKAEDLFEGILLYNSDSMSTKIIIPSFSIKVIILEKGR